ncbi:uncharacterized protein BJX67DRAFT_384080 [Aspergillus lucknowensis]|uniref:Bulb-type lectin domain-containing protein n=1 Tax=Aspergillus lucknowensis TaxID=176173 RepID=A0ABR4LHP8_9EURO
MYLSSLTPAAALFLSLLTTTQAQVGEPQPLPDYNGWVFVYTGSEPNRGEWLGCLNQNAEWFRPERNSSCSTYVPREGGTIGYSSGTAPRLTLNNNNELVFDRGGRSTTWAQFHEGPEWMPRTDLLYLRPTTDGVPLGLTFEPSGVGLPARLHPSQNFVYALYLSLMPRD